MTSPLHFIDPNPSGRLPVLFFHGLGADATSWAFQFPPLIAAGLRPIALDAPGFGQSPYDGRGWSLRRAAALAENLLTELRTGPAHLVGLSMGGTIAQQFALDFPAQALSLTLASTFTALRPNSLDEWFYFARRLLLVHTVGLPAQAQAVAQRVFPRPEQGLLRQELITRICHADPRAYRAAMRALGLFDSRPRLNQLRIPVLVLTGEQDTTVSPARQALLAAQIRGARHITLPQAGHGLNIDQPDLFNQHLLAFLRS